MQLTKNYTLQAKDLNIYYSINNNTMNIDSIFLVLTKNDSSRIRYKLYDGSISFKSGFQLIIKQD